MARSWVRDLEQRGDGLWPRFEPDIMRTAIAAVADEARWAQWRTVKAPTLLIRGQHGAIAETEVRQMLAARPDVTHVVLPGAGHDVHLERHDDWIRALTTFLDRFPP